MKTLNERRNNLVIRPLYELGLLSNEAAIKTQNSAIVGHIECKDVPAFLTMQEGVTPESFKPVKGYKNTFSISLIKELGLTL